MMQTAPFKLLLKKHREAAGMTKVDLANALGIKSQYIGDVEAGRTKPPPIKRCEQVADILKINKEDREEFIDVAFYERLPKEMKDRLKSDYPIDGFFANAKKEKLTVGETIAEYQAKKFKTIPLLKEAPRTEDPAKEAIDEIKCPSKIIGDRSMYFLTVKDDSMTDAGMKKGESYVLIDYKAEPKNGDLVAAIMNEETLIRKYFKYGEVIVLEAKNAAYQKIETNQNNVKIKGVVAGMLWGIQP